jgi:hypothetical protein
MFALCESACRSVAYSVNATVVPPAALGFLTLWPTGQAQPGVSTLKAPTGAVISAVLDITGDLRRRARPTRKASTR